MVGVNVGNCRRSWLRIPVGIPRGIVVDCPWLGAWLWTVRGLSTANAARRLARMLATRLATGCQQAKQHPKHFARNHARHKNLIWLRGNACLMKIHGMGCVRESKIQLCVARSSRQCLARLIRLRSTLHPPPGSGSFAFRFRARENFHASSFIWVQ
jgi:hypothetical protein